MPASPNKKVTSWKDFIIQTTCAWAALYFNIPNSAAVRSRPLSKGVVERTLHGKQRRVKRVRHGKFTSLIGSTWFIDLCTLVQGMTNDVWVVFGGEFVELCGFGGCFLHTLWMETIWLVLVKRVFSVDVVFVWLIFWIFWGRDSFFPWNIGNYVGSARKFNSCVFQLFGQRLAGASAERSWGISKKILSSWGAMNGAYSPWKLAYFSWKLMVSRWFIVPFQRKNMLTLGGLLLSLSKTSYQGPPIHSGIPWND